MDTKRYAVSPTHRFGEGLHTTPQAKLAAIANRMLRKAGHNQKREQSDGTVEAEACGPHGLRPTWHGKA